MMIMEAIGIHKQFHNREVVKGIDVEVQQGEILALIGTNGAGKSTTLAMLLGILPPDTGKITRWREDYKAHIGVQLQSTPFFEGYTAEENLRLFAALYNLKMDKEQVQKNWRNVIYKKQGKHLLHAYLEDSKKGWRLRLLLCTIQI